MIGMLGTGLGTVTYYEQHLYATKTVLSHLSNRDLLIALGIRTQGCLTWPAPNKSTNSQVHPRQMRIADQHIMSHYLTVSPTQRHIDLPMRSRITCDRSNHCYHCHLTTPLSRVVTQKCLLRLGTNIGDPDVILYQQRITLQEPPSN